MSQVIEFIKFLDAHDGSLLVIITFVYTVATIAICLANIISANAARAQLAEMKQQYEKEDRPHITYEMIFENRTFYGIRFTNHGRRVANHVQIKFSQDFLDSVSKIPTFDRLNTLQKQEFVLGIGRSYDYFFGADEFRNNPDKKPITGEIIYQDEWKQDGQEPYRESFQINWENYATFYSVNSPSDDLLDEMKKVVQELKNIERALKVQQSTETKKDTKTLKETKAKEHSCASLLGFLDIRRKSGRCKSFPSDDVQLSTSTQDKMYKKRS